MMPSNRFHRNRLLIGLFFTVCISLPRGRNCCIRDRHHAPPVPLKFRGEDFLNGALSDPYKPWTKEAPEDYTGSGVVIEGKAHPDHAMW